MHHVMRQLPWEMVSRWARSSALQARRNAMQASTDCAARRAERVEVDTFITAFLAHRATG